MMLATLFLTGVAGLYAQSVPGQLGTEIQAIEQTLAESGASSAERHDALARLARLRQLSGYIADAAAHWLDAAAEDTNDAAALTSGAYCLAAIGEWEKAVLTIRPLLASGRAGPVMLQAWFLDACLRAWSAGDISALVALAGHPEFAVMRPLIYYTLWQTKGKDNAASGGAEMWKSRLLAEFPQSPEARAVHSDSLVVSDRLVRSDSAVLSDSATNPGNEKDTLTVTAVQSPLWQLLPGNAVNAAAAAPKATTPANATPTKPVAPVPAAPTAATPTNTAPIKPATPAAPAASSATAASTVVLQTGLFSKEANARAQSEALRKAGFTSSISRKLVKGEEYWAVAVPAGQDQRKTAADLKKAGFDSFPVK